MDRKIRILLAAVLLSAPLLPSCLSDGDDTIVLEGKNPTGIYRAIPKETVDKLKYYMPINEGNNPPNIEGCYEINPCLAVYCEDEGNGGFEPGHKFAPTKIRFYNQDSKTGTIDYEEKQGKSVKIGKGAFVSGSGDDFSVYFDTYAESQSDSGFVIHYTTALLVSGTIKNNGIQNINYAFTMVSKENDRYDELMEEGIFRVINDGDGLAEISSWNDTKKRLKSDDNLKPKESIQRH